MKIGLGQDNTSSSLEACPSRYALRRPVRINLTFHKDQHPTVIPQVVRGHLGDRAERLFPEPPTAYHRRLHCAKRMRSLQSRISTCVQSICPQYFPPAIISNLQYIKI